MNAQEHRKQSTASPEPLLEASGVCVRYGNRDALRDVSLRVERGEWLSIVGESGSGKSTLLRCLAHLQQPDSGELWFEGCLVQPRRGAAWRAFREGVQLVMQDAATALNPRWQAKALVTEPLELLRPELKPPDRERIALEWMAAVGLPASIAHRKPSACSGGERQRLQLARVLTLQPRLLLLDEPFAGLDLPVQRDLLQLLVGLRTNPGLTCVLVTHDLELAWSVSSRIGLLEEGTLTHLFRPRERHPAPDFHLLAQRHTRLAQLLREVAGGPGFLPDPISTATSGAPE
ncbi:MAG: ATP-binding cassette domain-containing protein [Bryobacterales bacterium]|jgi:peptide/nickel transport system ATP-binding protein|nr:ATP-binding cassette domain-containing protein [Bryobacterales bacterium]